MRRALCWVWPAQLLLVLAAALFALAFHLRLPNLLVKEADYEEVAAHLARHARPGDAVLLFPWWTDRARLHLPPDPPLVGYLDSDTDPLRAHPRIWVLAQPRLPRADEAGFLRAFLPERVQVEPAQRFGNLALSLYRNDRHLPVAFSAPGALAQAEVFLEQEGGLQVPCPRSQETFHCPGGGHLYVRKEWHEVRYQPRRCLYAHAPGGKTRLVISFPRATLGAKALLEAGYIWEHAVKRKGHSQTFVTLEQEGGAVLARLVLPAGEEGFFEQWVEAPSPDPGEQKLRLTVQADNPDARQVCLDLTGFGAPSAEAAR